ncbi:hypothetical protein [Microbacterium oxydans]|uniref:hypothetical protein n=1 Tax=Microbacterium oxydans TaxID=82380 RepID=UPI00226B0910|nr:hypothetical protein [Microbacterium oxydans]WAA65595.1 hypothetical protein MME74_15365 [Microbacterium oxydans]
MELEITVTPCETLVWAPAERAAQNLRRELTEFGYLVRDADPFELTSAGLIPKGAHLEFDPARIFDVGIGAEANASLHALTDSGHSLVWHRWQTRLSRKVWGVPVAIPRKGRPRAVGIERATHFGTAVRSHFGLGLRISRETYATINKRSSLPRWRREDNPELWDSLDWSYEDAEHRFHSDEWCEEHRERALQNFDLNMAHFASLDREEFERALQSAVASRRGMVEVTDLTKWDGVPGLYIMVLDEYCQVYVGVANSSTGIAKRIRQHWTNQKQFDRLIWGNVTSSILSIDSLRALDTTRIFALKTKRTFDDENPLLEQFPRKFTLNRVMGGNDVVHLAGFLGVAAVMRTREFITDGSSTAELDPA